MTLVINDGAQNKRNSRSSVADVCYALKKLPAFHTSPQIDPKLIQLQPIRNTIIPYTGYSK
jgi:hypothetical protein